MSVHTAWQQVCIVVLLGVAIVSCSDVPGEDPYALFKVFTHRDARYEFRYLSPPWQLVADRSTINCQLLAIDPNLDEIEASVEADAVNAQAKMVVTVLSNYDEPLAAAKAELSEWASDVVELTAPVVFKSAKGQVGYEVRLAVDQLYIRAVFHALSDGTVVVMALQSRERLDDADITLLLRGLEPARNGDHA